MTQEVPWTTARIWTTSGAIALASSMVVALNAGAKWFIVCLIWVFLVALWVLERVARKANAAAAEQAVVIREQALAEQVAREQAAAERAAREAVAAQEVAAMRAAEQARAAAADQAADQVLFEDLVQEAHRKMAEGRSGE